MWERRRDAAKHLTFLGEGSEGSDPSEGGENTGKSRASGVSPVCVYVISPEVHR